MRPALKNLLSPDLSDGSTLPNTEDAIVAFQALLGPSDGPGEEAFAFVACTPSSVARLGSPRWVRGLLLVDHVTIDEVEASLRKLLLHCEGPDWQTIAMKLDRWLEWECAEL